jgi:ParB-like nuclease domain
MRSPKARSEITEFRGRVPSPGSRTTDALLPPFNATDGPKEQLIRTQMALNQITPAPRNPKTHSRKQIRQIADSIRAFGFINPLVVTETGELIARFSPAE